MLAEGIPDSLLPSQACVLLRAEHKALHCLQGAGPREWINCWGGKREKGLRQLFTLLKKDEGFKADFPMGHSPLLYFLKYFYTAILL